MVLNSTELRIASVTKCVLVFKACQAVVEGPTKTIAAIHSDVLNHLTVLVKEFKDPNVCASQLDIGKVRESHFELFIVSLKSAYTSGKTIWDKFKNMKSLLVNHCNCHYNVPSGWNVERAQLACKDKMFLHVKNKAVIAKNKKLSEGDKKELLTDANIDKDWFSPEWCTWKVYCDCLLFLSLRQPKEGVGVDGEVLDSEGDDKGSDDDISPTKKLKAAKKRLRSIISKSPTRNKQKELMKKRKAKFNETKQKNNDRKQQIDDTSKHQSMITKTLAFKNNIEFVKLLNDGGMDVSDERRKQIMDVTFQSFIAQNAIDTPNEVNTKTKEDSTISKKNESVDDDVSNTKGSISIKEIEIEQIDSDGEFQSVIQSILDDEDVNDCVVVNDVGKNDCDDNEKDNDDGNDCDDENVDDNVDDNADSNKDDVDDNSDDNQDDNTNADQDEDQGQRYNLRST